MAFISQTSNRGHSYEPELSQAGMAYQGDLDKDRRCLRNHVVRLTTKLQAAASEILLAIFGKFGNRSHYKIRISIFSSPLPTIALPECHAMHVCRPADVPSKYLRLTIHVMITKRLIIS